jgi:5'-phosphate synthase pdxT subunit
VVEIRESGLVSDCDALLVPGGESTTISRLVHREGIADEIQQHVDADKPVLATCAGLILLSSDSGDDRVETLDLLDVTVERNAFGRQRDSFEAPLSVAGLDDPFPAVFIRAPAIDAVGEDVEMLAEVDGRPVAVRQGPILGTAFHPELRRDSRIHDLAFFEEAVAPPATEDSTA